MTSPITLETTTKSKSLEDLAEVKLGSIETTTHRIFKPYPAINKPTFQHKAKKPEELTIIQAKVEEITTEKSSKSFTNDFFDRYYKNGWREKDVKNFKIVPDFLRYAIPMPIDKRNAEVKYVAVDPKQSKNL